MQYEFRAKTLTGAVRKSLARQPAQLRRKSSATIDTDFANYNYETVSVFVEEGYRYTISWSANDDPGDGGDYAIDIRSYDGHGSYRGSFRSSGSWDFTARTTGEIEFAIGVSRSFRSLFRDYSIDISID